MTKDNILNYFRRYIILGQNTSKAIGLEEQDA